MSTDLPPLPSADSLASSGCQTPSLNVDPSSTLVLLPTPSSAPDFQPFIQPTHQPSPSSRDPLTSTTSTSSLFDSSSSLSDPNEEDDFLVNEDGYVYGGMEIDSDRDGDVDMDEEYVMQVARLRSSTIPPLPPSKVFLYLLLPFLKLGAILSISFPLPKDESDNKRGGKDGGLGVEFHTRLGRRKEEVLGLVGFAILAVFTRQVWYMLARYIRRADFEEIVLEAFVPGHHTSTSSRRRSRSGAREGRSRRKEREAARRWVKYGVRFVGGVFRILLVVVYLRVCADILLPLLPPTLIFLPSRIPITILLALILSPLCFARSLASLSMVYASWASIGTFVLWAVCMMYAKSKDIIVHTSEAGESLGELWQGLSLFAFAFSTSTTLPLYASLRGTLQQQSAETSTNKGRRTQSFRMLSLVSVVLAVCLILPGILVSGNASFRSQAPGPSPSPSPTPSSAPSPSPSPSPSASFVPLPLLAVTNSSNVTSTSVASPTSVIPIPTTSIPPLQILLSLLSVATLALSIPFFLITIPPVSFPPPLRRHTKSLPISRLVGFMVGVGVATGGGRRLMELVSDLVMGGAFLGGFGVPAALHIIIHNLKKPIEIVMPPMTPTISRYSQVSSPSTFDSSGMDPEHATLLRPSPTMSESRNDELLQRKERTLQRRRLGKRIGWDLGVWVLLVPVVGVGVAWGGGRIVGRW